MHLYRKAHHNSSKAIGHRMRKKLTNYTSDRACLEYTKNNNNKKKNHFTERWQVTQLKHTEPKWRRDTSKEGKIEYSVIKR